MVLNMIQEPNLINGVEVGALMDCDGATSVCKEKAAFQIFKNWKTVFCSNAHKLLILQAFGDMSINIYDTYFTTWVKACDAQCNQCF